MGAGQKLTFPSPQVTQDDIRRFGMTDPTKGQGTIPLTSDPINQTKVLNEEVGKQIVAYSQIDPKQKQFRDNTKAIVEAHFAAKKPLSELTAELALNEDQVALLNNVMGTNIGVHSQSNVLTDVEFNSILRLNPQKKTEAERRNANASAINKEADAIKRLVRAKELEAGRRFEVPKGSAVDALNVTKGFSFGQMSSKGRISLAPGSLLDNPFNRPNYTPITGSFYNAESF